MWFERLKQFFAKKNMDIPKREIRIFISSTFTDMQSERDALIKEFNHLKIEASKRGVSIIVVDLRWGITEAESAQGRVIDICLKEINKSKPYFIGIVGDHYGSVPPLNLSNNAELTRSYPDVANEIKKGKSYTEIEMQYGVLNNPESVNAFFYIKKDSCETDDDSRLKLLKTKIKRQKKYPVYTYNTADDIASQIDKDFMNILNIKYPETRLSFDDEVKYNQSLYKNHLLDFHLERPVLLESIKAIIEDNDAKVIQISGSSGLGKSTMCARIIQEYTLNKNFNVSYYFAGVGSSNEELADVVSSLLGHKIGYEEAEKVITEKVIADERTRLLVIDGLDSLELKDTIQYGVSWLSLLPSNYKVILSVANDTYLNELIVSQEGVRTIECLPLGKTEKLNFAIEYLKRISKKLEESQLERIINNPLTDCPAVLRILLDELSVFGYYERLNERIGTYLGNQNIDDFYGKVLSRIEKDFNKYDVKLVFKSLILSRRGLAEDEIMDICQIRRSDLSMLLSNCPSIINSYGNLVNVTNNRIKEIFNDRYQDNLSDSAIRRKICDYFYEKCKDYHISFYQYDKEKRNFLYNDTSRIIHEVAFQLYNLNDYQSLYDFLITPSYFEIVFRTDRVLLHNSWISLESQGFTLDSILESKQIEMMDKYLIPVFFTDLGRFATAEMNNYKLSQICNEKCMTNYTAHFGGGATSLKIKQATLTNQAIAAYKANNYDEALKLFKEALTIKLSIPGFGRISPEVADGYKNLATIQKIMEHYDEAISNYVEALDIYRNLHKSPNKDIADTLYELGYCYYRSDDDVRAYQIYSEAYDMYCALEGKNSENAILSQFGIGRSLTYANKLTKALDILNEVLDKSIAAWGEKDTVTKDIYFVLGYLWEKIAKTLQNESTTGEIKSFIKNSATCYLHAEYEQDAQRMLDKYNALQ